MIPVETSFFADIGKRLVQWYQLNGRDLPWRQIKYPYAVWISEIILQQTRVAQGTPYFHRFLKRFPDVYILAAASDAQVLKAWEGLGYYSRARNLHKAARIIVEEHNGHLPAHINKLMLLPGIGPYTARAIASFAYGMSCAVLDGNVYRILSRVQDDPTPINENRSRSHYQRIVDGWLGKNNSPDFNQAIMDLGSTVCKPKNPDCHICPLQNHCLAYKNGTIEQRPQKKAAAAVKILWYEYRFVEHKDGRFYITQRGEDSFWKNMWELPKIELADFNGPSSEGPEICSLIHKLTHRELRLRLVAQSIDRYEPEANDRLIHRAEMAEFAFPTAMRKLLKLRDEQMPVNVKS